MKITLPLVLAALSGLLSGCRGCEQQAAAPDRSLLTPDATPRPDQRPAASAAAPAPAPAGEVGQRRALTLPCAPPMLVGAGELDGAAGQEIVVACDDTLLVLNRQGQVTARTAAEGWPQVLLVADLGRGPEVLVGWGTSRKRLQARARLLRYRLKGKRLTGQLLLAPETTRNQFADLALERSGKDGAVLLAYFTSKYMVRHVRLGASGKPEELGAWRMAMSLAPTDVLGPGGLLVGRLYGDKLGLDGDAFVWRAGKRVPVPTTRGVRAVSAADLDGDGKQELLLCDGWAQRYAAEGRALLTVARRAGRKLRTSELLQIPGEYTINEVQVVDVDGDGSPEILARGSTSLRLYKKQGAVWQGQVLARNVGDALAVDLDGKAPHEVVVVGQQPAIISLEGVLK
jgi:hypothetical protein